MKTTNSIAIALLVSIAVGVGHDAAAVGLGAEKRVHVAPGNARAHGESLADWFSGYTRWLITGQPESGRSGKVVFMPLPQGVGGPNPDGIVHLTGHQDATLEPGESFFVTAAFLIGERYLDGSEDPIFGPDVFDSVQVTLDGVEVMAPLDDYFVPAQFYDPEIVYDQPTDYGSVAALYSTGYGFLRGPLRPGVHTMTIHADFSSFLGTVVDNTFTITVK